MSDLKLFPNVNCPHCSLSVRADILPKYRIGKNKHGNFVFLCPNCQNNLKIEPSEYLFVTDQLRRGELPEGVGFEGYKEFERMPSEPYSIMDKMRNFFQKFR